MPQTLLIEALLSELFKNLPERSRDVIISRFGIGKKHTETLESIGKRYTITRERVRQIEADALKSIRARDSVLKDAYETLAGYIRSRGGVVEERLLKKGFAEQNFTGAEAGSHEGAVGLLLALSTRFKKAPGDEKFSTRWYLEDRDLRLQEQVVRELVTHFKKVDGVLTESEVLSYVQVQHPDLSREVILSYIAPSEEIRSNVFGKWGLREWPEIRPRGVRDKAHLVLKHKGEPLHFTEVASLINQSAFSMRPALAQTVHNELIKDKRFVLVGRGTYALRTWGYEEGTVKDVIAKVLGEKGPLSKDDIVKEVLAKRMVKPSTVMLNLNSFKKGPDGKYMVS